MSAASADVLWNSGLESASQFYLSFKSFLLFFFVALNLI
jgi:hypothetical protein